MRPKIEVQIRDVDQLITERPELREYLELHKLTLRARIEIEGLLGKGTDLDLGSPSLHRELQDKALKTGKPISHLISPSLFNHELLSSSLRRLLSDLRALSILEGEQIDKLIDLAQAGWNFSNVLMAVLRNDRSHLERLCSELKLDWKLLLFAFSILLQPLLEELARNLGGLIVERWWQADCPVCGRLPIIAKMIVNAT